MSVGGTKCEVRQGEKSILSESEAVGARVRSRRKKLGLTQQKVAQLANISIGFVSEIENGGRNPSGRVLLRLGGALRTTTDWILRGQEPKLREDDEHDVFPPELSVAAKQAGLSYAATISVLKAFRQVVACRGSEPRIPPTSEEWTDMYRVLKRYIEE